jgi:hypothetical protein
MNTHARFFLVLAIVGFVVPNTMVVIFAAEHGLDLGQYLDDWFATLPSSQLVADLTIVAAAFLPWAAWEGRRIGEPRWWWTLPATFLVGLCFAVPLFLYLRERALERTPT